jgi:DNA segregation ATPase FtsK/SpoIIIE-like protein
LTIAPVTRAIGPSGRIRVSVNNQSLTELLGWAPGPLTWTRQGAWTILTPDASQRPAAAMDLIGWLKTEMMDRHRTPSKIYRPIFLVIEEWAALPERIDLLDAIDLVAAQGRSAHCGIIAVTQRPTATKVIRTTTRGNLPIKVAHSTAGDYAASEAILGGGVRDAADLPTNPPGFALIRIGGESVKQIRVFRWSPESIRNIR